MTVISIVEEAALGETFEILRDVIPRSLLMTLSEKLGETKIFSGKKRIKKYFLRRIEFLVTHVAKFVAHPFAILEHALPRKPEAR